MYVLLVRKSGSRYLPVASFTEEVNPRLAKSPLVFNGRLANRGLTSLVKEATGGTGSGNIPENVRESEGNGFRSSHMFTFQTRYCIISAAILELELELENDLLV